MDDGDATLRRLVNSSFAFVIMEEKVLEEVAVLSVRVGNSTPSIELLYRRYGHGQRFYVVFATPREVGFFWNDKFCCSDSPLVLEATWIRGGHKRASSLWGNLHQY